MNSKLFIPALFTAAVLSAVAQQANAQSYVYNDLGAGQAKAINDAGQIVGTNLAGQAMLWNGTSATDLSQLGHWDVATGINNSGAVAGFYDAAPCCNPRYEALTWNGTASTLNTGTDSMAEANGINNNGTATGFIYAGANREQKQAVLWNGGAPVLLGTVGGSTFSDANAINNSGQEVGYLYQSVTTGVRQAVLWNGTTPTLLGTLSSNSSTEATALNNNGQEVGYANAAGNQLRQAVLWNGTAAAALGSLGGTNSAAFGINNAGDAVGYSYTAGNQSKQAVLWEGGKTINLNTFLTSSEILAGWVLINETAINDSGAIVGIADNTITGKEDAFVLNVITAVPEPTSLAMLLAGLGVIAFVARRRKADARVVQSESPDQTIRCA